MVNFSARAVMGMYLAHVLYEFRETGDLVLPIVGLPARVHLLPRPTVATAVVVMVVYAVPSAASSTCSSSVDWRRHRRWPELSPIGLFLYLGDGRAAVPEPPAIRRILPSRAIQILGHPVFQDRLWSAVVASWSRHSSGPPSGSLDSDWRPSPRPESRKGAELTGINSSAVAARTGCSPPSWPASPSCSSLPSTNWTRSTCRS